MVGTVAGCFPVDSEVSGAYSLVLPVRRRDVTYRYYEDKRAKN